MKVFNIIVSCLILCNVALAQSGFNIQDAQAFVNLSEYDIRWQDAVSAYQSPNRNQNIRSTFIGGAVNVKPRIESDVKYDLTYEPVGVFRDHQLVFNFENISQPIVERNKIIFNGGGASVEYVNNDQGLRQNFILQDKKGRAGELTIRMQVKSDLKARYENGAICFYYASASLNDQPVLTYTDLKCWDANGSTLAASMSLEISGSDTYIDLKVEDAKAVYPITIDPLTSTPVWVLQGTTTYQIQYTASGDFNGDGLTDLLAGAPSFTNGQTSEGVVKLYYGLPGGVFDTTAAWSYESNITSLNMGSRIANAGDINNDGYDDILIGANFYDNGQTNEGICYLFLGNPTTPAATPNWAVESNTSSAEFGFSVAGAGDVNGDGYGDVVIGAYKHTTSGRAFVYLGSATGLSLTGTTISGPGSGSEFGYSVAGGKDLNNDGYDDIVVTGRLKYSGGAPTNAGNVSVFNGTAAGISTTSSWTYSSKQADGHLGITSCVADVNGDGRPDILSSAIDYDTIGTNYGLVHVFLNSPTGFSSTVSQLFLGTQTDEGLGTCIANLGDINNDGYEDVAVGSPSYDNTSTSIGRIYIFTGSAIGLLLNPIMVFSYDEFGALSGRSMAGVGDVNGDGYDDFVSVNAVYNEPDKGSILLYYGSDEINMNIGLWNKKNTTAAFGTEVERMDFDNNGWQDLLIGAPYFDGGSTDEGKLFVYLNEDGYIDGIYDWSVESQQPSCFYAASITDAGDINGDGFPDVAVGAFNFTTEETTDGAVFIYFGEADLIPDEWSRQHIYGGLDYGTSGFGRNVRSVGDVNNDGFDDLLITAENYQGVANDIDGEVYIYYGSAEGLHTEPDWRFSKISEYASTGAAVITNIDINGDDINDIVISSPAQDGPGLEDEGNIDVFYGTPTGFPTIPSWTLVGEGFVNNIGLSLSSRGDINGDGYDDFLFGERHYEISFDTLQATLVLGTATLPYVSDWYVMRRTYYDLYAYELEISADVNGDGYDDMFVSRAFGENGQTDEGVLELYYGGLYGPKLTPVVLEPNIASAQFSAAVLGFPDNNGDGVDEFVVGAPNQTTNFGQGLVYFFYGTATTCNTPGLAMTTISETSAGLSITGTEDVYYIKWKSEAEALWHLDSTTTTGYTISGLSACTNYMVKIQAGCTDGFSMWTDVISFTTDCTPCTYPPTGLYADNITATTAKLHWNVDPDATKYKISYKATGAGAWINTNATSNFKNLSGLSPSTTYQYKVKTVCAGGLQSAFSPTSSFTTLPFREGTMQRALVDVYPNPANMMLHVEYEFVADEIKIYDLLGNVAIEDISVLPQGADIDLKGLPNGLYTVVVRNADTFEVISRQFIKM